jgi:tetratricopeptide (TPR) repeat protein
MIRRKRASAAILLCLLLALAIALRAGDRNQNWIEVRSPHFIVLSNSGEKDGRHVAGQFENIRALFHTVFSKARVDPGKPTIIFALRNEDSLKLFLPDYGTNPNAKKLAGLFLARTDMNFALVRTDVSTNYADQFHTLYHEYTHSILRMNFRGIPLWLDEGFAEFYGSTQFDSHTASFGMPDANLLRLLQRETLIPVATLVSADPSSPLYNTRDHSGIFYAESWAIVHYFMMSPEVRKDALLDKYLATLQATDDPIEAAHQSFGDLRRLADKLEGYARQPTFYYAHIPVESGLSEKDFTARPLPLAEALTQEANFLLRGGAQSEALKRLHEAEDADPNHELPALHEALGYYHFLRSDNENAEKEFDAALLGDPKNAASYYYKAEMLYRKSGYSKEATPIIRADLERAIEFDPDFAPAHAFLCIAYIESEDTKPKAIAEAKRAIELEPGNLAYYIDLGRAALANGKTVDAQTIADRAQKAASTGRDRSMAASFAKRVASHNTSANAKSVDIIDATPTAASGDDSSIPAAASNTSAEGQITELICGKPPEVLLTLSTEKEQMLLHVADIGKIPIQVAGQPSSAGATPCAQWKDRKAKMTFDLTPDGTAHGEVRSISFF